MGKPKFPTSKELKWELRNNKLGKIYLFIGEEEGEKEKFIKEIVDIVINNKEEINYSVGRFHIENDEFIDAADFALSQSVFSDKKICIMLGIQHLKSTKSNLDILNDLFNNLPDFNTLIMTSEGNRLPECIKPENTGMVKVFHFWRHFENNLHRYIYTSLKNYGIDIERDAVYLIIELLGRDIKKIDEAIEKIVYSGERGLITSRLIKSYIYDEKDISIFDFIDALFKKEKRAFNLLKKLIENGVHELIILRMILRQAEKLEKYYSLLKKGTAEQNILNNIGVLPRNRNNFLECVKMNSLPNITKVFILIYRADYRIKNYNYSKSLAANPIFELVNDILFCCSNSDNISSRNIIDTQAIGVK